MGAAVDMEKKLFRSIDDRLHVTTRATALAPFLIKLEKGRVFYASEIFSMRREQALIWSKARATKTLLDSIEKYEGIIQLSLENQML